jgi:hypothetical protein
MTRFRTSRTASTTPEEGLIEITVQASHLMEPNPHFAFAVMNEPDDIFGWIKDHPCIHSGFRKRVIELKRWGVRGRPPDAAAHRHSRTKVAADFLAQEAWRQATGMDRRAARAGSGSLCPGTQRPVCRSAADCKNIATTIPP